MKLKTRQKIISAALSEVNRNPEATLDHIAVAAGVSRITVFRYFSNRQQLIFALKQEASRIFLECVGPLVGADLPADMKLRKLVEVMIPYGATFRFLLYEPYRSSDPRNTLLVQEYRDTLHHVVRGLATEELLGTRSSTWWAMRQLDTLLWMAWDAIDQGELDPHAAQELLLRTFYHGVGCGGRT
ncbi:MAG: TetR/AcrR family transcriptional regulator [Desulfovibrionaceae bacterium]